VSVEPPPQAERELLERYDVLCVRAQNPGPFTLSGTNTWLVERAPTWVIDPGPLLEAHVERLHAAIEERGGLGGIALTHDHRDHAEALGALRERHPAPLAAGRGEVDVTLAEGVRFGPLEAVFTPGHAPDHYAFIAGAVCFTGDAVLGMGSVFITPDPGAMAGYLQALERLRRRDELSVLCPGHGPVVTRAKLKLTEYLEHRRERERNLKLALERGLTRSEELLAAVWPEVPAALRPAALATLAAHLDKLEEEGALPAGVKRPSMPGAAAG
jgi:glyoxylase-like metal-dependent hydrolase (beta-lactamase superfamily II)